MELLAPAGNMNMLYEAVYNGADAVYLGLEQFNARIKADNFSRDNIADVTKFCHIHGVKVYVVINISVKNSELDSLVDYIVACNSANIDAFIVSDIGTLELFNRYAPTIPLHASTQMAIHNVEGARIAKKLGFSRVVVARETLYDDIRRIKDELGLEVEYFVHGALCVAFSGNCLFSSIISGNSGNRGRCLQPCRQEYTCTINNNKGYLLSPKDQCLLGNIDDMRVAHIDSLKIEGRLKSRNYVRSVIKCYRYTLDTGKIDNNLYNDMLRAFNRGEFTKGYNYDSTQKLMSPNVQGNIGLSIGTITKSSKVNFEVATQYELKNKYGIKILSNNGYELGGMQINGIKKTKNGYLVKTNRYYPVGSDVRITLTEDIESEKVRLPIDVTILENDTVLTASVKYNDICVSKAFNYDRAMNRATTVDDIMASMAKLGDNEYTLNNINITYNDDLFIAKSQLNAMRRELISLLDDIIIEHYNSTKQVREELLQCDVVANKEKLRYNICVELDCEAKVTEYVACNANIVVNVADFYSKNIQSIINKALTYNKNAEILLKLPNVARGNDMDNIYRVLDELEHLNGIYADNLYCIDVANRYGLKVFGGQLLNIYNIDCVKKLGLTNYMVSSELNISDSMQFGSDSYVFAYGYLPLMTLTHCPMQLNTGSKCNNCKYRGIFHYNDTKGSFALRRIRNKNCIFTLYNSVKHNIIPKCSDIDFNFYLSIINDECDVDRVLQAYIDRDNTFVLPTSTYGHTFRGVK